MLTIIFPIKIKIFLLFFGGGPVTLSYPITAKTSSIFRLRKKVRKKYFFIRLQQGGVSEKNDWQ